MLVEGATEVEFVKRVLAQPLSDHGVAATPVSMDGDVTSDRMARKLETQADPRTASGLSKTAARPVDRRGDRAGDTASGVPSLRGLDDRLERLGR